MSSPCPARALRSEHLRSSRASQSVVRDLHPGRPWAGLMRAHCVYTTACPVHTNGGRGLQIFGYVCGGGAEFLRLFCHFRDPRWEICHSGGPQMIV